MYGTYSFTNYSNKIPVSIKYYVKNLYICHHNQYTSTMRGIDNTSKLVSTLLIDSRKYNKGEV